MHNKTIFGWFLEAKDEILNISTNSLLLIAASIIFLVLMTQGRRTWLNFFHFIMFASGILYIFFPRALSSWVTGELDDAHVLLIRLMGMVLLTWVLCYFLLVRSTDTTAETSVLLALSIMVMAGLLEKGHMYNHPAKESSGARIETDDNSFMFFVLLLSVAGTLFHLFRSNDWGGYAEQLSHANFHLRIDFVLLLLMGIVAYTMPQSTVKMVTDIETVDTVHKTLARTTGSYLLGMAMLSTRSANFLRASDKEAVVVSHWICYVATAVLGWCTLIGRWGELPWKRTILQAIFDLIVILNATGALNRDVTVFKRVVFSRFMAIPQDMRTYFKLKRL